jgi:UDP-N-acetylmuramoyl-tripeptide--D-alanyl-D-alanine ligase
MRLRLGEVAEILGVASQAPEREVQGYSIDSRTLAPGQLFFALRGPRFDGHQFVASALERGAAGAVVEKTFCQQAPPEILASLVSVPDTLQALQELARAVRRQWGKPLIAVTGSTGKSTAKEMVAALLARRFAVHKSPGNLNNNYGLPLALLDLEPFHEVAVVELAMSAPGEIARLAQLAEPEIGLVTNVAPVHLEFFESVDAIGRAKRELIDYLATRGQAARRPEVSDILEPAPAGSLGGGALRSQGALGRRAVTAVLNRDDERVQRYAEGFPGRVVSFGFQEGADFRALEVRSLSGLASAFRVQAPNWQAEFHLSLPGRHNVQNALAALAAASLFDIPVEDLRQALAEFQNLHHRGEILTLPAGVTVIDDTYNSNPVAMERMLETLAGWPGALRRVVVAGEMLELGPSAPALHRQVGRRCAESRVDLLIGVQGQAESLIAGAIEVGLSPGKARFFPDARQAGEFCRAALKAGDVVLVKGSRAVRLEAVIELLRSSPVAASPKK